MQRTSLRRYVWYTLAGAIIIGIGVYSTIQPSHHRTWSTDQAVLPTATIDGDIITIYNIRNFSYTTTTEYTPNYYDKTFNLRELERVWYIVEPFDGIPGSAHTFLSFEFANDQFVAISAEIRKEQGETYHPIKGLFRWYELMYVIADERDVILLRANHRRNPTYVYPVRTTTAHAQQLFVDMLTRANQIAAQPEFYNTLTNTCTTNIVDHVRAITPSRIPRFDVSILLPASSDALAYDLGLLDTDLSFEDARQRYHINERALRYATSTDFSVQIRSNNDE